MLMRKTDRQTHQIPNVMFRKRYPRGIKCLILTIFSLQVSIYDLKGDVIWDLGSGHRNELHFNLDSIMAICSFGNLASGKIQLWNFSTRTIITELEVPHTTHFEFSPDGQYFWLIYHFSF